ncbi:hypothetical protein C6P40_002053 [Pichia californica]|uniref:Gfd2/YDR514C-like C-terminal domain-containing protein n=1 Tax=Pichia californica TaxID=460514 RepID=A0A9P7BF25_9ASCO|nr:hypothetical protein C6P42_002088 [[Candida] californica]KAG0687665.1 hypothetical protein C6P40_002053 [[Candida] californica]
MAPSKSSNISENKSSASNIIKSYKKDNIEKKTKNGNKNKSNKTNDINNNDQRRSEYPLIERSFLNHNSYPDINTDNYETLEDLLSSENEIDKSFESDNDDYDGYDDDDSFTKEKKKSIKDEEIGDDVEEDDYSKSNLKDIFDLDQSRSPDSRKFNSLDSQLKYEIEKCINNLKPQYKIPTNPISKRIKDETQIDSLDISNKKKNLQVSNDKNNNTGYRYLSVEESIELVNKREYTLISIDNEFFERSMSKVIEIGLSIYNPSYQKFALFPQFFHIHFIIKEFINLRNGVFVPDSKMNNTTGQSIIISKNDIPSAMSLVFKMLGPKVCLVGHNISGDLSSFKYLNYQIPSEFNVIDTVKLWYSFIGNTNNKSALSYILDKLGIPNSFLHNGANDAYYTLVVCLMLTSPELINNLSFHKKKIVQPIDTETIDNSSPNINIITKQKPQPPDFSNLDPEEAEIKLKRWNRKQIKLEEKEKKKKMNKVKTTESIHIRCSIDNDSIAKKMRSGASRKNGSKNPAVNKFFKPKDYDEENLIRKLEELGV